MHLYLIMVLAAFAIFIGALGYYSLRQSLSDLNKR